MQPADDPMGWFSDPAWWGARPEGIRAWPDIASEYGPKLGIDGGPALAALRALFPVDVCMPLLRTDEGRRFMLPYYAPFTVNGTTMTLLLGDDLAACTEWADDTELLARLRSPSQHTAARFELGVWSGLRRRRLHAWRPRAARNEARPDLMVSEDGTFIAIELKTVTTTILHRRAALLDEALNLAVTHVGLHDIEPCTVTVKPTDDLLRWATEYNPRGLHQEVADSIYESAKAWFSEHKSLFRADYTAVIPGVGTAIVSKSDHSNFWSFGFDDIPATNIGDYVLRASTQLFQVEKQLTDYPHALRAGVVWLPAWHAPLSHAAPHLARRLAAKIDVQEWVPKLDLFFLYAVHDPDGKWIHEAVPLALTQRGEEGLQMNWVKGLTNWRLYSR